MPHPLYDYGPPTLQVGETGTPASTTFDPINIPGGSPFTPPSNWAVNAPPGGSPSEEMEMLYDPHISSLAPNTGAVGAARTVTVNGTNFFAASKVEVNQMDVATTYVSATALTAVIPDRVTAGTVRVTVRNPTVEMESNGVDFTFTAAAEE